MTVSLVGATFTASSELNSGYAVGYLFDASSSTLWASNTIPAWVQAQLGAPVALVGYCITPRIGNPQQAPKTWIFSGSNDGTNWTTLDTRTAETFTSGGEFKQYLFTNTTAYLYYRLNMTAGNGDSLFCFSGLELLDTIPPVYSASTVLDAVQYKAANAFDHDASTLWVSTTVPAWLQALYPAAVVVNQYTVQVRSGYGGQAPAAWTFIGSNDGSSWDTLDTKTAQSFGDLETKTYALTNTTAYLYYRINVTACVSGSNIAIAEMTHTITTPLLPAGPTAQVAFSWGGVQYAKGDLLPIFRSSQMRHLRQRGYANSGTTLVVGKPFLSGGVLLASGAAIPAGLTDAQLRRLVASRHLV